MKQYIMIRLDWNTTIVLQASAEVIDALEVINTPHALYTQGYYQAPDETATITSGSSLVINKSPYLTCTIINQLEFELMKTRGAYEKENK